MTPPPAATAAGRISAPTARPADPHRRRVRRSPSPRTPRRVSYRSAEPRAVRTSGPAVALPRLPQVRLPRPSLRPLTAAAARAGGLLRGRALIWALAGLLLGLVFLQVTLLKLNTQISQNVERAESLERANATARSEIARLDAGHRIKDVAAQLGMVMPGAGSLCYLDARRAGACTGGDPAAAGAAVDPTATTAPPAPDTTDTAGTDPAATDPAAATAPDPAAAAPADQGAQPDQAATTAPAATAPDPQSTPAPAATPDTADATGGLAATGGTGG